MSQGSHPLPLREKSELQDLPLSGYLLLRVQVLVAGVPNQFFFLYPVRVFSQKFDLRQNAQELCAGSVLQLQCVMSSTENTASLLELSAAISVSFSFKFASAPGTSLPVSLTIVALPELCIPI